MDAQRQLQGPTPEWVASSGYIVRDRSALSYRRRISDDLFGYAVLSCGIISILTTFALIVVLSQEGLRFFSIIDVFRPANKAILSDVSPSDTVISIEPWGARLRSGSVIQISDEILWVEEVLDSQTIVVQRGYHATAPAAHGAESEVSVARTASLNDFLTGSTWQPQAGEFGVLPLLSATLETSMIALLVALPFGLSIAIYLSEYASQRARALLKPTLEMLAGIPTVVYGYVALTLLTPALRSIFGEAVVQVYNTASAGIAVGIMITPTISSMSEDALNAVPTTLRQASYALGATRIETVFSVLLPAAASGIMAAFIVGLSRAVSEPVIVALAAGAGPRLTLNPFEPAETIAGHITRIGAGDVTFDTIDYHSLFALGLLLFLMTLLFNVLVNIFTHSLRERYE